MSAEQKVMGLNDLCQFLRVGPTSVYLLRRNDPTFPQGKRIGRTLRWLQADIEGWMRANPQAADGQQVEVAR
jgi:predicted DNA-binding transcriptional regulator AlpA